MHHHPKCAQCGTETQLYVSDVPTCLDCVAAQEREEMHALRTEREKTKLWIPLGGTGCLTAPANRRDLRSKPNDFPTQGSLCEVEEAAMCE
jgi:hypothetical protein